MAEHKHPDKDSRPLTPLHSELQHCQHALEQEREKVRAVTDALSAAMPLLDRVLVTLRQQIEDTSNTKAALVRAFVALGRRP